MRLSLREENSEFQCVFQKESQVYQQKEMNADTIKQKMRQHIPSLYSKEIMLKKLSGLTNVTYAIYVNQQPLFIFKTFSDGFDREMENRIVTALAERELTPRIIAANATYRIQKFLVNTEHPTNQELSDPNLQRRIVQHMHLFHQVPLLEPQPTLSDHLFSPEQQQELQKYRNCKSKVGGNQELFPTLFKKVEELLSHSDLLREKLLPSGTESVRMCHNDLNNLNILFESDQMHFIDYDYVGSNYLAYDIANFLNEATIDYSLPQYPGFTLLEPLTFEQIKSVAEIYPAYYSGLDLEVLKFMCVCNLYWAVWSIKRFPLNTSETFGVVEHGMLRLQLFQHYFSLIQKQLSK